MKKMRILHFSLTATLGGIETFQRNLFSKINKDEFEFEFVTTYSDAAVIPSLEEMGGKIHYLPPQKTIIPYCIKLYKLMKNGNYDAVHIHKNSCANPMVFIMAKLAGIKKIIAHSHNTSSINGGIVNAPHYLFRPLVRKISHTKIACSPEAAQWLFGKKYVIDNAVPFIKNGIDINKFSYNEETRKQMREELSFGEELIIGHIGNFIPQKNHYFMVDIMAEVIKILPDAKLLFIGRGEESKKVLQYAKEKGTLDNIIFMGSRSDVDKLYQAMDVFLFPSLHEGLPIAGVEAQTAGLLCYFSDAISKEIILTDNVIQLSLGMSGKEWAEIIASKSKTFKRQNTSKTIIDAGYSIDSTAIIMEEIYKK